MGRQRSSLTIDIHCAQNDLGQAKSPHKHGLRARRSNELLMDTVESACISSQGRVPADSSPTLSVRLAITSISARGAVS